MDYDRGVERNISELFKAILELEYKIDNLRRTESENFKEELKHFEIGLLVAKFSLDQLYEKVTQERMAMKD